MAATATKPLVWFAAILLLCAAVCLFLYALKLGFTESLYSRRGTFAFIVTVSEPVIRSFPVVDATDEAQYRSGCGDGPKLPDQAIFYHSRLSVGELLAQAQRHIASHGYAPSSNQGFFPGLAFASDDKTLYLNVSPAEDGTTRVSAQVWFDIYQ